jgi:hypothetical protein
MSIFSEIEKSIERGFRRWTERAFGAANSDELVLVHRAILEEIGTKVQTASRGQRMFPYTRLVVTLVSPDPDRRALYQAAFGERLGTEVRKELEAVHCEVPRSFAVEVRTAEDGPKTFDIQYEIAKRAAAPMTPGRLTVIRGKAVEAEYGLTQRRTNIGRNAELTDTEQRVVRRNDIVFEEGADEANGTVSRGHAHIRHEDGEYRLCDDGSEYGTRIFREGRSLAVPSGGRGEKLRPGDEIYVGRACLRFER